MECIVCIMCKPSWVSVSQGKMSIIFSCHSLLIRGAAANTVNTVYIPLYMNASSEQIGNLHKVLMTAARTAIGSYCYKKQQ